MSKACRSESVRPWRHSVPTVTYTVMQMMSCLRYETTNSRDMLWWYAVIIIDIETSWQWSPWSIRKDDTSSSTLLNVQFVVQCIYKYRHVIIFDKGITKLRLMNRYKAATLFIKDRGSGQFNIFMFRPSAVDNIEIKFEYVFQPSGLRSSLHCNDQLRERAVTCVADEHMGQDVYKGLTKEGNTCNELALGYIVLALILIELLGWENNLHRIHSRLQIWYHQTVMSEATVSKTTEKRIG